MTASQKRPRGRFAQSFVNVRRQLTAPGYDQRCDVEVLNCWQMADVSWFVVRFATEFQYLSAADIDARAGPPCRSSYECVSATDVPLRCSMLLDPRCHAAPLATLTLEIMAHECVPEERAQRFWRINTSCLAGFYGFVAQAV